MKHVLTLVLLLIACVILAANPDVSTILKAIDANMTAKSSKSVTRLVVNGRRSSRTVASINYAQGTDKFYTEYTAPPRDKGTKMLKLGKDLWIYDPGSDRSIKISGNMLKQSVMGSDLSYEDFMEETKLVDAYSGVLKDSEDLNGRTCWVLELTAKQGNQAYHKRKLWVDKERNVVHKEYLYAKSGKLLKSITAADFRRTGNRWYPYHILFKDELKDGKGTEYFIDSIEFEISIPPFIFTKAMLKK